MFKYFNSQTDDERDDSSSQTGGQPLSASQSTASAPGTEASPCASPLPLDASSNSSSKVFGTSVHCPPLTPVPWGSWTQDDTHDIVIRGKTFLENSKKIPCGQPIYRLAHVDMFHSGSTDKVFHVASRPDNYVSLREAHRTQQRNEASQSRTASRGTTATASSRRSPSLTSSVAPAAGSAPSDAPLSAHGSPSTNATSAPAPGDASTAAPHASHYLSPLIVINFLFPGPSNQNMNLVMYFTRAIKPAELLRQDRRFQSEQNTHSSPHNEREKSSHKPSRLNRSNNSTLTASQRKGLATDNHTPNKSPRDSPTSRSRQLGGAPHVERCGTAHTDQGLNDDMSHLSIERTESFDSTGGDERDHSQHDADYGEHESTKCSSHHASTAPIDIDRVEAFDRALTAFLEGSDEEKDSRVKIIPRIAEGPWLVKKGVGRVPAILGKKIKQSYTYDRVKNYFEIDIDVSTSMIAGRLCALVKSAATNVVIELTFLLQGECEEELPESLIGGVRLVSVDLAKLPHVDENSKVNNAKY